MEYSEERLLNFSNSVLKDADNQKNLYLDKIQKKKSEAMEKAEKEFLAEIYNYINTKMNHIKNETNQKISKKTMENRREILKKRDEIYDETIDMVINKLKDFTSGEEYKKLIVNTVKNNIDKIGKDGTILYIGEKDEDLKGDIMKSLLLKTPKIEIDVNIKFGGFKIVNSEKHIIVDETVDSKIDEQKDYFAQISKLTLE